MKPEIALWTITKAVLWISLYSSLNIEIYVPDSLKNCPDLTPIFFDPYELLVKKNKAIVYKTKEKNIDSDKKSTNNNENRINNDVNNTNNHDKNINNHNKNTNTDEKNISTTPKNINNDEKNLNLEEKFINTDQKIINTDQKNINNDEKIIKNNNKTKSSKAENSSQVLEGKPNPTSDGEILLFKNLKNYEVLKDLFTFNTVITTIDGSDMLVDLFWKEGKLVVEVDGYTNHGKKDKTFRSDRHRDYLLQISGYRVLRLTVEEIRESVHLACKKIKSMVLYINENNVDKSYMIKLKKLLDEYSNSKIIDN
ncbi:MAG: endonuclease domain-containing protein [Planctomycetaceae bacterium]|nr:endonuclease domain-containing protein [Planctomycetaceae bacterium]